jgi:phosphate-selective porin OprO and OprP
VCIYYFFDYILKKEVLMMNLKTTAIAAAVFSLSTLPTYAGSEIETLINMLHENGMVSDEQYGRLVAELKQNQTVVNEEKVEVQKQLAEATKPDDVEIKVKGGITVKTRDGKFSTKLGGRVQADGATYSGEPDMGNGTEIRRARIYLQGNMYYDWGYKLQYDFAHTGANGKGIADAFITYDGFDDLQLKVGNFKDPFMLQEHTSSKFTLFTERAVPAAFFAGRHIGVMASTSHKHWSLVGALVGESVSADLGEDDEGWGAGSRVTFSPINEKTKLVHLGVALNYRDPGDDDRARFKQTPESHVTGVNIVDTRIIANVDDYLKVGLEAAVTYGPFSAQAEYVTTSVNRSIGSDLDFDGWYVQTGYFFTGESRNYQNRGAFASVTPKGIVGEGGIGAWEFGLRYSSVDLSDADIDGGEADLMGAALNWYPTPTLRFSANYIDVLDIDGGANDGDEPSVFQVRSQWAF